ncbi:MAG: sigma factor-like helix-turn-helix DNA-binding protein [Acidimicrobiales bacterium]
MRTFLWPADDGWPYPDSGPETADPDGETDDDLLSLRTASPHLLDDLDTLERQVISARFGLDGAPLRSMKELHAELGLPRQDIRVALGSGLAKLRSHFAG